MTTETIIRKAEFNPQVCTYWLLSGALTLTLTIVGIPFLFLWFPFGLWFTGRYLARMECILTEKTLKVHKGVFIRVEKTVPLEKITDMGMVQGPIMRAFNLHRLSVETAGQSGQGALIGLTGIVDATGFRQAVLDQRDSLAAGKPAKASEETNPQLQTQDTTAIGIEIRDSLLRIEKILQKRA